MEFIVHLPAVVKIVTVFVSILFFYRIGLNLGLSILVHSCLLALMTGAGIHGIRYIGTSFFQPSNYLLLVVILMLLFFTEALRNTGRMERTVSTLKETLKNVRFLFSSLPALVGLLPMPGGAIFSAPLIATLDSNTSLTPSHKSAINYWFRHIWEYWWPLYPGVILAIKLSNLSLGMFLLIQMPFTLVSVLGGYFFILKKIEKKADSSSRVTIKDFKGILATLIPILLLVAVSIIGSSLLPRFGVEPSLSNLMSMPIGLFIALVYTFKTDLRAFTKSIAYFKTKSPWLLLLIVGGVLAFSATLQMPLSGNSTIISIMRDEFMAHKIPLLAVIILIPFISGAVTGVAVGFVGASFPLVFALIGDNPPLHVVAATTSLAYVSGYTGMMLSPLHVCFTVTNQYFKSGYIQVYKYLWKPATLVFFAALLLPAIYYTVLR